MPERPATNSPPDPRVMRAGKNGWAKRSAVAERSRDWHRPIGTNVGRERRLLSRHRDAEPRLRRDQVVEILCRQASKGPSGLVSHSGTSWHVRDPSTRVKAQARRQTASPANAPDCRLASPCDAAARSAGDSARSEHSVHLRFRSTFGLRGGLGVLRLELVVLLGFIGLHEPDGDEVQRADEAVADAEAARAGDCVAQRHCPVVLD